MRIAIDASQASKNYKTGVENFSLMLINSILKYDDKNQYYLLTNSDLKIKSKNASVIVHRKKHFWNKFYLPLLLYKGKYDLFLEPGYTLPSYCPKNSLVFIHDLAFKYYPNFYSISDRLVQESSIYLSVKKARVLLFLTQTSKNDFVKFFPNLRKKTEVVGLAPNKLLFKNFNRQKRKNFLLTVGRIEMKKNISNLIYAYTKLRDKTNLDPKLYIAGKDGYGADKIKRIALQSKYSLDIIFLGYVSDEKLAKLYNQALAFVFPTYYEGFGIPVLEAFSCNLPVIASHTPSIIEVAKESALFFNPKDPNDIYEKIKKVINSPTLQKDLVKKGKKRLNDYDWHKTAQKIINIFNSLDK